MEQCILTVGTVTYAIRARKLLSSLGIRARLVKGTRPGGAGGCAYGVEIPSADLTLATDALTRAGISYEWSRSER
jgi:hypothetical protein